MLTRTVEPGRDQPGRKPVEALETVEPVETSEPVKTAEPLETIEPVKTVERAIENSSNGSEKLKRNKGEESRMPLRETGNFSRFDKVRNVSVNRSNKNGMNDRCSDIKYKNNYCNGNGFSNGNWNGNVGFNGNGWANGQFWEGSNDEGGFNCENNYNGNNRGYNNSHFQGYDF